MLLAILSRPWWRTLVKGSDDTREMISGQDDFPSNGDYSDDEPEVNKEDKFDDADENNDEPEELAADDASVEEVEEQAPTPRQGGHPRRDNRRDRNAQGGRPERGRGRSRDEDDPDDDDDFEKEQGNDEEAFHDDDPFSEAFDLENGRPLQDRADRGPAVLPWRSKVKAAKDFFGEELLYRFDILEQEERDYLRGNYRIELKGYRGGVWTIMLGDELNVVNRREEAEIVFTMQQKDFLHLVNGEINPQLAILAQKIRIQGDMRKAVSFQALLAPSAE